MSSIWNCCLSHLKWFQSMARFVLFIDIFFLFVLDTVSMRTNMLCLCVQTILFVCAVCVRACSCVCVWFWVSVSQTQKCIGKSNRMKWLVAIRMHVMNFQSIFGRRAIWHWRSRDQYTDHSTNKRVMLQQSHFIFNQLYGFFVANPKVDLFKEPVFALIGHEENSFDVWVLIKCSITVCWQCHVWIGEYARFYCCRRWDCCCQTLEPFDVGHISN